jgi:hypothetical protein
VVPRVLARDHENAILEVQHIDVMPVQRAEHILADNLVG